MCTVLGQTSTSATALSFFPGHFLSPIGDTDDLLDAVRKAWQEHSKAPKGRRKSAFAFINMPSLRNVAWRNRV